MLESSSYASDPGIRPAASSVPNVVETQVERLMLYRCKKCRRVIARDENVLVHDVGGGEAAFNWKKRDTKRGMAQERPVCTSIFVEPMQWMTTGALLLPQNISLSPLFAGRRAPESVDRAST